MLRSIAPIVTLVLLANPAQALENKVPFHASIRAYLSIVKGADATSANGGVFALDGSVVQLGPSSCMIRKGSCLLQRVTEGPHSPAIELIESDPTKARHRFLGTSAGSIVEVQRISTGELVVAPQQTKAIVFKLERVGTTAMPELVPAKNKRTTGSIKAYVSIVRGIEHQETGFLDHAIDVGAELDGSLIELGGSNCLLKNGQCTLTGLTPGTHSPGLSLKSASKRLTYRYLGTSSGSVVMTRVGTNGTLVTLPRGRPYLVYKLERTRIGDNADPVLPTLHPTQYRSVFLDPSLTVNLWMNIIDEREGVTYARKPLAGELAGMRLRIGKSECAPQEDICRFAAVLPGRFEVEADFKDSPDYRLSLDPDTRPLEITVDRWSKRPKLKDWNGRAIITVEKRILPEKN